jgi:NAD-dependent deacetylase
MTVEISGAEIQKAGSLLRFARHAVVLTGAGISTPSGIPDFRSQGSGLWNKDNPMEVASLSAFWRHPDRFFAWLRPLAAQIVKAHPNLAHQALADLEKAGLIKAVITQNIDGLHQAAGSQVVLELHGSTRSLTCLSCRKSYLIGQFLEEFVVQGKLPYCLNCGKLLKPDIVLFEEMLPVSVWEQAEAHCRQADLVLVVGSSLEVSPAGSLPLISFQHGAQLIILNFSPTYLDEHASVVFHADAAEILPQMAAHAMSKIY